jgi:hypothetical protein
MVGVSCGIGLITAMLWLFWPYLSFYQLTGRFTPISSIDTLASPVLVSGWSEAGLSLADGRLVELPGFAKLPKTSAALLAATAGGVELAPDGRVYGLLRINHWCGNDPMQTHIARVDLADMLVYLKEGQCTTPPTDEMMEYAASKPGGDFSTFGWNISEFDTFRTWESMYSRAVARQALAP